MSKHLLSVAGIAVALASLGSIGCQPTVAEQRRGISSKLRAPDPMVKFKASDVTRDLVGIDEWRLFRGRGAVYVEGIGPDGEHVSGLAGEVYSKDKKGNPTQMGVLVNDGRDFVAAHRFNTNATMLSQEPSFESENLMLAAMHDLDRVQLALDESAEAPQKTAARAAPGSRAAKAKLCAKAMVASAQSSITCVNNAPMSAATAQQCRQFQTIMQAAGANCFRQASQSGLNTGVPSASTAACTTASCKSQTQTLDQVASILKTLAGSASGTSSKAATGGTKAGSGSSKGGASATKGSGTKGKAKTKVSSRPPTAAEKQQQAKASQAASQVAAQQGTKVAQQAATKAPTAEGATKNEMETLNDAFKSEKDVKPVPPSVAPVAERNDAQAASGNPSPELGFGNIDPVTGETKTANPSPELAFGNIDPITGETKTANPSPELAFGNIDPITGETLTGQTRDVADTSGLPSSAEGASMGSDDAIFNERVEGNDTPVAGGGLPEDTFTSGHVPSGEGTEALFQADPNVGTVEQDPIETPQEQPEAPQQSFEAPQEAALPEEQTSGGDFNADNFDPSQFEGSLTE